MNTVRSTALVVALAVFPVACGTRVQTGNVSVGPADGVAGSRSVQQDSVPSAMLTERDPAALREGQATAQPTRSAAVQSEPTQGMSRPGPAASRPEAGLGGDPLAPGKVTTRTPAPPAPSPGGAETPGSAVRNGELPARGTPAVVASVGTYSGPIGSVLFSMVEGAQVWVRWINQKGGLNGHEVRMLVFDDGGDPARHQAQVKEAVERHRVIAFLNNGDAGTGHASLRYITEKQVPVVGSDLGSEWAYTNPMYFPQGTAGDAFHYSNIAMAAEQMVPKGKTKLATIACTEAQACADAERIFTQTAQGLGFQHVYRARASLVQPDFTAECLAARRAEAQVFIVYLDSNSVARLAASCARQDFRPIYSVPQAIQSARQAVDPNLGGMLVHTSVFPYFQTGTPATDEYQRAMTTFGGNLTNGVGTAVGWTSGKLLEVAGARLPEPPSSVALLQGLWSIRDDTLGGLTHPLTFVEGGTARRRACWFTLLTRNGAWVSPDGYRLHCEPLPA